MTVETSLITAGPFIGNGLLDTYDFPFAVNNESQVIVYVTPDGGDADDQEILQLNVDYEVNGVTGIEGDGSITLLLGNLATGDELYMRSNYIPDQDVAFESQGGFYPLTHERNFDKIIYLILQLEDKIYRTITFGDGYTGPIGLGLPPPEAGKYLRWKQDESGLENSSLVFTAGDLEVLQMFVTNQIEATQFRGEVVILVPDIDGNVEMDLTLGQNYYLEMDAHVPILEMTNAPDGKTPNPILYVKNNGAYNIGTLYYQGVPSGSNIRVPDAFDDNLSPPHNSLMSYGIAIYPGPEFLFYPVVMKDYEPA